jgi:prevent-host-death family protein
MATTLTSREFNQDTARAKRAAKNGPVFITDRGRPSHVLLTIEDYSSRAPVPNNLADALGMRSDHEFEFEPPRLENTGFRAAEFD